VNLQFILSEAAQPAQSKDMASTASESSEASGLPKVRGQILRLRMLAHPIAQDKDIAFYGADRRGSEAR
jgi:hypothetical protein